MKLAIVGLGKMGANMARRLLRSGHQVEVITVHLRSPGRSKRKRG
jgi:3-hydroxyisobutyrate dehydrogenase-like beta-hydroxyacid dehydrogenase